MRCPFHNEKTASFCVDTAKNLWFCHGACHEGGNVITFVMKMENLPFPLAVKKLLKEKKNISLTDNELQSTPEEEEKYKKKESMRIINAKLCAFFRRKLPPPSWRGNTCLAVGMRNTAMSSR